jgi:hypothetical protein
MTRLLTKSPVYGPISKGHVRARLLRILPTHNTKVSVKPADSIFVGAVTCTSNHFLTLKQPLMQYVFTEQYRKAAVAFRATLLQRFARAPLLSVRTQTTNQPNKQRNKQMGKITWRRMSNKRKDVSSDFCAILHNKRTPLHAHVTNHLNCVRVSLWISKRRLLLNSTNFTNYTLRYCLNPQSLHHNIFFIIYLGSVGPCHFTHSNESTN